MSIEHSLQNNPVRLDGCRGAEHAGNVVPLRQDNVFQGGRSPQRSDDFFAVLSPLLEEADGLRRDRSPHTNDFLVLEPPWRPSRAEREREVEPGARAVVADPRSIEVAMIARMAASGTG
jgi:hypothetical protein